MPKLTIEVPEGFEEVVKHLERTLQRAQFGAEGARAGSLEAFDAAWEAVNADTEELKHQLERRRLRAVDTGPAPAATGGGEPGQGGEEEAPEP